MHDDASLQSRGEVWSRMLFEFRKCKHGGCARPPPSEDRLREQANAMSVADLRHGCGMAKRSRKGETAPHKSELVEKYVEALLTQPVLHTSGGLPPVPYDLFADIVKVDEGPPVEGLSEVTVTQDYMSYNAEHTDVQEFVAFLRWSAVFACVASIEPFCFNIYKYVLSQLNIIFLFTTVWLQLNKYHNMFS